MPVLRGANRTLYEPGLKAVVMELNGSGARYGYDETEILKLMRDHGFETFSYDPFSRGLIDINGKNSSSGNTLFVRDLESVSARLHAAEKVSVFNSAI